MELEILLLLVGLLVQCIEGRGGLPYLANAEKEPAAEIDLATNDRIYIKNKIYMPTLGSLPRLKRDTKPQVLDTKNNLQKVTIEVERLFDSLNKRRSEIDRPAKENENENEVTVVIEDDGDGDDGESDDVDARSTGEYSSGDGPGYTIILDNTNGINEASTPKSSSSDFSNMIASYDKMNKKFETFLSEEKNHIPRNVVPTVAQPRSIAGTKSDSKKRAPSNAVKTTRGHETVVKSTIEADIEKLKRLKEKLEMESNAIDNDWQNDLKEGRSKINSGNSSTRQMVKAVEDSDNSKATNQRSANGYGKANEGLNEGSRQRMMGFKEINKATNKSALVSESYHRSVAENDMKSWRKTRPTGGRPTNARASTQSEFLLKSTRKFSPTPKASSASIKSTKSSNHSGGSGTKIPVRRVIHPRKAGAMIEYLNKDPLESWFYKYQSLQALGLNSSMLRSGLVNAGSIDRLKGVMERALKGEDITLSVVGGSISAGGGLYKDENSIAGLYYKGVVDWWNKVITPLTGAQMKVNNIAIGSIGTDYFSYCLECHISNDSNIVIWELSGNDYNRYLKTPTKGAKPLERLTRMALQLPRKPAIIYVNFFKGVDYKKTKKNCPNFEDQGEDIIAHFYKVPSLSWRAMVCESLINQNPFFTLKTLFCKDQYHPSLLAHAQMALLLILHLRHVMRSVLQYANAHDGILPNFASLYNLPAPLFIGLEHPSPLCWTLIAPDFKESIYNTLGVKVLDENGFKLEYATNFPIRFDRVICWKAEKVGAVMKFQITLPEEKASNATLKGITRSKFEIALTTHTRFGGRAEVWLDQRPSSPVVIQEGRPNDTGKRTQVDLLTQDAEPGVHTLNLRAMKEGFCLSSIMVF